MNRKNKIVLRKGNQIIQCLSIVRMLTVVFLLFTTSALFAKEETVVVGQVLNRTDKTPIQQVNIYFKNSTQVVQSNEEGYFVIRTRGNYNTLIFSCVGFKQAQIKLKPGQSVGIDVQLEEDNTLLQEVFVIPGANPAMEFMKRVQLMKKLNDVTRQHQYKAKSTEQNLVLLSKINQRQWSKKIFDQLKKGNISKLDSSLVVPIYMDECSYQLASNEKKQLSKEIFSSPEAGKKIIEGLVGDLSAELNFYDNVVTVFGKSMVSPLSNVGNAYYDYYLADSIQSSSGKQYEIHFRTKNAKNLAFNGKMYIDSASLALTGIDVELPTQANINYIHNLRISEKFIEQSPKCWTRQSEDMALNMNFELLADSLHSRSEIFIKRTATFQSVDSTLSQSAGFAQSNYSKETLDDKLKDLNNTPLLRTAKWIADVMFTGYMQVGKIDIGKVQQIIRVTDLEGLRLTLPLRTNENLWKNVSLGGYVGYGFKNQSVKYSGIAQFKLPGDKRRIFSLNYTNDYRRVDYNYNDYLFRENPLILGDADISSSVLAMKSGVKMSERKELSLSFVNEWNTGIESNFFLRSNQLLANLSMPMTLNGVSVANSLQQQSAVISTRFSFGERTYDDHMQRIYISNKKPVIYSTLEVGKYQFGNTSGNYGKIIGAVRQFVKLDIGQLNYIAEAGLILGNVPYPLLQVPPGSETGGYSTFQYNMMNYMEYAADKYLNLHSELVLNGLVMNQIPFIKDLNLREMCSFNLAYGSLNNAHKLQLDYPGYMYPMDKPYMEVGIGFTNILHLFTFQSVWRLTDLNHPGVTPWGLRGCLNLNL
jgi:hypothetical protein